MLSPVYGMGADRVVSDLPPVDMSPLSNEYLNDTAGVQDSYP